MDLIIKMLEYCAMSYAYVPVYTESGEIVTINDKQTDLQCFLLIEHPKITIIFRGSDSINDWKVNFKFWKTNIPYGCYPKTLKVHAGFVGTYSHKDVRKTIHSFMKDSITKVYITGHSYGAALAALCALDLKTSFPKKDYEVVLFGCPRVGNRAFKKFYNLKLFKTVRVENRGDIVTKVPFLILGFRHIGAKIKIGHKAVCTPILSMKHHNLLEYYSNIWGF